MKKTIRQRRLKAKTDYKARLTLLKSGLPRLVVRKTNRYVLAQIVESEIAKDKVLIGITSKDLIKKGWPKEKSGSLKSLPACYLTGFFLGVLAKEKVKSKSFVLDIGMNRNIQKSRIFAVLKGALDAGLEISHSEEALPSEEELNKNEALSSLIKKIQEKIKQNG